MKSLIDVFMTIVLGAFTVATVIISTIIVAVVVSAFVQDRKDKKKHVG